MHRLHGLTHLLNCCRIRTAASCVAILLLGGLLAQLFWSQMQQTPRRLSADFIRHHQSSPDPRSTRRRNALTNASCSGHLGLLNCISNASWNHLPPAQLQSACRHSVGSQTKTRQLVLVFVPVTANMFRQRATVRRTWGRTGAGFGLLTFLVLLLEDEPVDSALKAESGNFGDIFLMRGPTEDSYQCLTLKILSFLRWYSDNCRGAFHYLLKSDHDSYWNLKSLYRLLERRLKGANGNRNDSTFSLNATVSTLSPVRPEILGGIQIKASVQRTNSSKFCTPPQAFAPDVYPTYALGGPGYLISDAAVANLTEAANRIAPFWLEDVYITGMLAASSVPPVRHGHLSEVYYAPSAACLSRAKALERPPLGTHRLSMRQIEQLNAWLSEPLAMENATKFHLVKELA